jgi:hypothetical protein
MAEIKSAIEIAMEKTKTLRLSSEEKEKIKEEEFQSKAHGLVNRFLVVDLHFREVEKELAKYSAEQRGQLEKIMLADLADALDLDRNNDLVFEGIETLSPEKEKTILRAKQLMRKYQEQRGAEHWKTEEVLRSKLEAMGVSGSAVLPKVEGSLDWAKALPSFQASYQNQLQALKEEIENRGKG